MFIADKQTLKDDSLLLVEGYNPDDWVTVRVGADYANVEATRLSHGARSVDTLQEWAKAEEDGVYKGVAGEPAVEALQEGGLLDGDY